MILNMATPGKKFREDMSVKRVGRNNKPGINKAAQAVAMWGTPKTFLMQERW